MADKKNSLVVKASAEMRDEVLMYVKGQILTALNDRSQLEDRWIKWVKQYEEILPEQKDFPWPGCSNISLPLTAIAVETIHAREVNTLLSLHPYIQVKPKKKGVDKDSCAKIEQFLEQIFLNVVDFHEVGSQWILEKNKMGTGYLKAIWDTDSLKVGGKIVERDDAKTEIVAIEDLIFPSNAKDLQTAPWVAHRLKLHWTALKAKGKAGIYQNVDKLEGKQDSKTADAQTGKDVQGEKQKAEKIHETSHDALNEFTIYEVHLDYDIDDDGYPERTVITVHLETDTILRWIHLPYKHGKRPFVRNVYQGRASRIYGKGICELSEHLQDAINTAFNQTIDNMTLANAKCFKRRRGGEKDKREMTVYPGKVFDLDDVTDLQEFSLGDVHQSNFVLHTMLRDYHERRTKVTDYTVGKESATMKSRATATGTLALLQESGRHFDLVINNSRKAIAELAYQVVELYAQYRPEKIFTVEDDEKGTVAEIMLPSGLDAEYLRENYQFACAATSLSVNKEIEKQSNLMMLQQLGSIFSQMIQLLTTVMNPMVQMPPELQEFVYGVIRSYYNMAKDLVRSFEKADVESYVPELPEMIREAYGQVGQQGAGVQQLLEQLGGMFGQTQQGGNAAVPTGLAEE